MWLCSPQEGFGAKTRDNHVDRQSFHQERHGMVQQIPFHEDAQHHRWCKEASWKHKGSYQYDGLTCLIPVLQRDKSIGSQKLCLIVSPCPWLAGVGPVSPPKVVYPLSMAPVSFEQVLSDKLHSTLIRPTASKKVLTALLLSKLAKPTEPLHQPSHTDASDVKSKIVTLLHTCNSVTASHDMSSNNSIIVQGTRKKEMHTNRLSRKIWLRVTWDNSNKKES